jgi:hypothetical protein
MLNVLNNAAMNQLFPKKKQGVMQLSFAYRYSALGLRAKVQVVLRYQTGSCRNRMTHLIICRIN